MGHDSGRSFWSLCREDVKRASACFHRALHLIGIF
jgi:hypothetical protein